MLKIRSGLLFCHHRTVQCDSIAISAHSYVLLSLFGLLQGDIVQPTVLIVNF